MAARTSSWTALGTVLLLGAGLLTGCAQRAPEVTGEILTHYQRDGVRQALGEPVEDQRCGLPGDGCEQAFQRGRIFWSPSSGAAHLVAGPLLDWYTGHGGPEGDYGWPAESVEAGARQLRTGHAADGASWLLVRREGSGEAPGRTAASAPVSAASATAQEQDAEESGDGVVPVRTSGAIGAYWLAHREQLGAPTPRTPDGERCGDAPTPVCRQSFDRADLLWDAAHGAQPLRGAFRGRYEDSMGAAEAPERTLPGGVALQSFLTADGTRTVLRWSSRDGVAAATLRGRVQADERGYLSVLPEQGRENPARVLDTVAAVHALGEARGPVQHGPGGVVSREHAGGVAVLSPEGTAVAMSAPVLRQWLRDPAAVGDPVASARGEDGVLRTRFTGMTLAHHPERAGLVMAEDQALGAGDALVLGDSQLLDGDHDGSWVSRSIRALGWTPHYRARGGIGVVADGSKDQYGSYLDGVAGGRWVLPAGNPGLVYVQGSGNDVGVAPERLREGTARLLRTLKEAYPNSRIVLSGVISKKGATARDRVADTLQQVARAEDVEFVPLRGKITEWHTEEDLVDGKHFSAPVGHEKMAAAYTPYLRERLAR